MENKRLKILICGYYNKQNTGDEAFKLAFKTLWPNFDLTFVSCIQPHHVKENYSLVIIGGGDMLYENVLKYLPLFKCAKIALSISVTTGSKCDLLKEITHFYVRDYYSLSLLKEWGYVNSSYLFDVAGTLKGSLERGKKLIERLAPTYKWDKPLIGINTNAYFLKHADTATNKIKFDNFTEILSTYMDSKNAHFVFLPFSVGSPFDDRVSQTLVYAKSKWFQKNSLIFEELSVQETLDVVATFNKFITCRFHGIIFSLVNKIPVATISIHTKFTGLCEQLDLPYADYYDLSLKELKTITEGAKVPDIKHIINLKDSYEKIPLRFIK